MALPSAFQERLRQMEETRNQRLALLQAEKDLQSRKSEILSAKLSILRRAEQRCLLLEKRQAEVCFRIISKKAGIEAVEARYEGTAAALRAAKAEAEELEEKGKEKDGFYETKVSEMEGFKKQVRDRTLGLRLEVQNLRASISALRSDLQKLQENDGCLNNPEIAAAEAKRAEHLAAKESLERSLATNVELRALLQRQLRRVLSAEAVRGEQQTKLRQKRCSHW